MRTPESMASGNYDFEMCCGVSDMKRVIEIINLNGWELVCVTPAYERSYFVFFRRLAG